MNEYNERILKTVLQDYRAENDDALLKELEDAKNDPLFQVSDEEAKAFAQNYIKKTQKKKNSKIFIKAASVILSIILAGVIFVPITVEGRKSTVAQFVFNFVNSDFLAFDSNEDDNLLLSYEGMFIPTYIPDGYYVKSISNEKNEKTLTLTNDSGKMLILSEQVPELKNDIDHEDGIEIEEITILGYNGIYYEKNNTQFIIVLADDIMLSVICNDKKIDIKSFSEKIEKR